MTIEEYNLIAEAISDLKDKMLDSIERHTNQILEIINLQTDHE